MTLTPRQPSLADFPLSVQRKGSFGFAVAPLSYANQSQVFGGHLCERGNLLGNMDSVSHRLFLLIIHVFTHGLARGSLADKTLFARVRQPIYTSRSRVYVSEVELRFRAKPQSPSL